MVHTGCAHKFVPWITYCLYSDDSSPLGLVQETRFSSKYKTNKVKVAHVHAVKAYGGSRYTAPIILKLGTNIEASIELHPLFLIPGKNTGTIE